MKPSDDLKKLYQIYTGKDAQTISELISDTGLGETAVRRFAAQMVSTGIWKEVLVKRGKLFCRAYIKIK